MHPRLLSLAAAFATMGSVAAMPNVEEMVTITIKDIGKEIRLPARATLVVKLDGQPGTGYGWDVVKREKPLLKLQGKPTTEEGDDLPGGFERQVFRFKAESEGTEELKLIYVRPFEPDQPAKTFKVKVVVR